MCQKLNQCLETINDSHEDRIDLSTIVFMIVINSTQSAGSLGFAYISILAFFLANRKCSRKYQKSGILQLRVNYSEYYIPQFGVHY